MGRRVSSLDKTTVGIERDVGSEYDNVKLVADNLDRIVVVADNLGSINLIISNLDDVNTVAENIEEISNVSEHIVVVAENMDAITTISDDLNDVNSSIIAVHDSINEVINVSTNIDGVIDVSDNMAAVLDAVNQAQIATNKAAEALTSAANAALSEANAASSATSAEASQALAAANEAQTTIDAASTASDVLQTSSDASSTSADRAEVTTLKNDTVTASNTAVQASVDAQSAKTDSESARDASVAAKDAALISETNSLASATSAGEDAAATAADRVQTGLDIVDSAAYRDKAEQWSSNPVDVPVEPGKFSAYHWADIASRSVVSSVNSQTGDVVLSASDVGAYTQAEVDSEISTELSSHVTRNDPHPQYLTPDDLPSTLVGWLTSSVSTVDTLFTQAVGTAPDAPQSTEIASVDGQEWVQLGQWLREPVFTEAVTWYETNVTHQLDVECNAGNVELALDFYIRRADTSEELVATSNFLLLNNARETYTISTIIQGPLVVNVGDTAITRIKVRKSNTSGGSRFVTLYMEGDNTTRAITFTQAAAVPADHAETHEVGGSDLIDHDNLTNAYGFKSHNQIDTDLSSLLTDQHNHTNKAILDATTASYTTEDKSKLDLLDPNSSSQAVDIDYDNVGSGLVADNVQDAVDELETITDGILINSESFTYRYSTSLGDSPSSGKVQLDAEPPTVLYYHQLDSDGRSRDFLFSSIKEGDTLAFQEEASTATRGTYTVSGSPVLNGSVYSIPVEESESPVVSPSNNSIIVNYVIRKGSTSKAANVTYSNLSSGLTSTDVQSAIDESYVKVDESHGWGDHAAAGYASATDVVPVTGGTFTGEVVIESVVPAIFFKETDVVDNNAYLYSNGGSFSVQRRNDNNIYEALAFVCNLDGPTTLYYNGDSKFATSSTGVGVTGVLDVSANIETSGRLRIQSNAPRIDFEEQDSTDKNWACLANNGDFAIQKRQDDGTFIQSPMICFATGEVRLGYGNSQRLETSSTGVSITGNVAASGSGNFNAVNITSNFPGFNLKESDTIDQNVFCVLDNGIFQIQRKADDNTFLATAFSVDLDGATSLKYNGFSKLATTTTGVNVAGEVTTAGGNSNNWNTAYSWGDHALAGYALGSDVVPNTGGTFTGEVAIESTLPAIFFKETDVVDNNAYLVFNDGYFAIQRRTDDRVFEVNAFYCDLDGETRLHYNGFNKLATTTTGVRVTGNIDNWGAAFALGTIDASGVLGANKNILSVTNPSAGTYDITLASNASSQANMICQATFRNDDNTTERIMKAEPTSINTIRVRASDAGGSLVGSSFSLTVHDIGAGG